MDAAQLLTNTLSPDAAIRTDAEQKLEAGARENYVNYMAMLTQELANEQAATHIRNAAGLAVKNALTARETHRQEEYAQRWKSLSAEDRSSIKALALQTLGSPDARAGLSAAQVIAAIAAIELPDNLWPDLIPQLLTFVNNQENVNLRKATLEAIGFTCEIIRPDVLAEKSNEILTAVVQGARKEETSTEVQYAAINALYNSIEFVRQNFEREGERNYIMQVVCEATQNPSVNVQTSAFACLVRIMQHYYEKMSFYMQQALFGLTVLGMQNPEQAVALQAVEFWSTVCDCEIDIALEAEEAQEYGELPERTNYKFAVHALPEIVPVLLTLLTRQDEDADEDEWDISKSAATCLNLLAQCAADPILNPTIPFIENNIRHENWHHREAAVMAFGSILEGPDTKLLAPLVTQALPTLIEMMRDPVVPVKDTTAWTLGRILDVLPSTIKADVHLHELVTALVQGLEDNPRIVANCCWSLSNLAENLGTNSADAPEPVGDSLYAPTAPISPYFDGMMTALMRVTERGTNESNSRTAAYEAISSLVQNSADDTVSVVSTLAVAIMERMHTLLGMQNQLVGVDDRNNYYELQSNFASVEIAVVRRLGKGIKEVCDRLMTLLLQLMQSASKQSTILEDAFLAVGAITAALEQDFAPYMSSFVPYLLEGLKNVEEYQLCSVSVGLIGDVCRALGEGVLPYSEAFMSALLENLQSAVLHRDVKPAILSAFGDVALAIGGAFEPYLATTMLVLTQAGGLQANDDWELQEYVTHLREGILEAYVGIVTGLKSGNRVDLLLPHVQHMFGFLNMAWATTPEDHRTDSFFRGACGLLGDLADAFPSGQLKDGFVAPWVGDLLKAGRARSNSAETKRVAKWAKEMVKRASA